MSKISSRGWRYARSGPIADVLHLNHVDLTPGKEAVVVKMHAAPLHRTDAAIINGTALGRKLVNMSPFPRVGGCEGVGSVVAAGGGGSSHMKEGDLVWVSPINGTWATHVVVPANAVHKIDKSMEKLAVNASNYLAAQQLLQGYARLKPGKVVIQNGGSSVTSLAVAALAQRQNVPVFTAAAAGERFEAAKTRHAKYGSKVFEYNGKGARAMAAAMGNSCGGAALYLNGVGGRYFDTFMKLMAPGGHVVTYGAQNSFGLFFSGSSLIYKEVTMQGLFLPTYLSKMSYEERQVQLDFVLKELSEMKFDYPTVIASSLEKLPDVWDEVFVRGGKKGIVQMSSS